MTATTTAPAADDWVGIYTGGYAVGLADLETQIEATMPASPEIAPTPMTRTRCPYDGNEWRARYLWRLGRQDALDGLPPRLQKGPSQ